MARIVTTNKAVADLKRIWRFIALDNAAAATRLLLNIDKRIALLATFPEQGSPHDDVRPGCRIVVVMGYRVLYEYHATTDTVEIVAVAEPYRDLDAVL